MWHKVTVVHIIKCYVVCVQQQNGDVGNFPFSPGQTDGAADVTSTIWTKDNVRFILDC